MVWLSLQCLETVSWSVNAEKRVYTLQVNWPPFCDRCLALGLRLDVLRLRSVLLKVCCEYLDFVVFLSAQTVANQVHLGIGNIRIQMPLVQTQSPLKSSKSVQSVLGLMCCWLV